MSKRSQPHRRDNTKLTGERSEAAFLNRAAALGFGVAKPWGDSLRYDFILDNGERLIRVQIKCTESIRARAYETRATYTVGNGRAVYTRDDVDFLAAHVVPLDIWYIIPVEVCMPAPMLRFYPHREAKRMRLEKYREAWHLMQSASGCTLIDLHAMADEACGEDTPVREIGTPNNVVILSEDAAPRRGSAPQSKDPYLDSEHARVGTASQACPISDARVGADALVRPAERSSAALAYPNLTWLVPRPAPK
jgi:hypothetical protein